MKRRGRGTEEPSMPTQDPEIQSLLDRCGDAELMAVADGTVLLQEGDTGQDLFLLLRGSWVVEKEGTQVAAFEAHGEDPVVVGEMAYFGADLRTATVKAVGAGQAVRLSPAQVDRVLEAPPLLGRLLFRQFTRRLQETTETLRGLQSRLDLGASRRMAQTGEVLFREGEPSESLFQVGMGTVRVGDRRYGPGSWVELEDWLRGRPWSRTAVVEETAFLGSVSATRRGAFLAVQPGAVLALLEKG